MTPILKPDEWAIEHRPAATAQATCTKAASANARHVIKSITASVGTAGAASTILTVVLRDSTTGAGNVLWSCKLGCPLGSGAGIALTDLNIPGVKGQAVTLEFTAGGPAGSEEDVSMTGYTETMNG